MCGAGPYKGNALAHENLPDHYFGLRRRQPPAAECEQMRENLAKIFESSAYRSVLYIGANKRRQYFLDWFEKAGYDRIVILEAFKENADCLRADANGWTPALEIVHGDIRDPGSIPGRFDVSFFWHGPEHLKEAEIGGVLKNLEVASKVVVLGCPYGVYRQGAEYGNPYEEHLSHLYPPFMEGKGYKVDTIGRAGEGSANMLAWKFTGRGAEEGVGGSTR